VLKQEWKERPELLGVSDGARTFFLLSKGYLSADWQMNRTETDAFRLALNLLFYATDLGTLEGKFASGLPETPPAKARDATAVVARIRHGTGVSPRDWAVGAQCWPRFAPYLQHISGCKLEEKPGVNLAQDDLSGVKLLHLTGREAFEFSDAERAALKKYVQKGGTLLVDAYGGAGEFATAARREMEALFGALTPLDPADLLATGQFEGGANLGKGVQFSLTARRSLRDQGLATQGQKLEVARIGKRAAVFFSRFDLTGALGGVENYQAAGYKAASARKIAGNLLAYAMAD
jgi:hypothetical protein